MCGKASAQIRWQDVYAFATALNAPDTFPEDPAPRINISPSRLRRQSEPDSMVWESLPVIHRRGEIDEPGEAVWPYLPHWSNGRLPKLRNGKTLSTANARLRRDGAPFAPTYLPAWKSARRTVVPVSWFYEFDGRTHPKVPYAVFPLDGPCWLMAGLYAPLPGDHPSGRDHSVAVITVEPNQVLESVGHNRSPALLRDGEEAATWLTGEADEALSLLRPYPNETMGVEAVDMGIKIPGNQNVELPGILSRVAIRETAD